MTTDTASMQHYVCSYGIFVQGAPHLQRALANTHRLTSFFTTTTYAVLWVLPLAFFTFDFGLLL